MASFEIAIADVLRDEGGKSDAKETDRGGKTNFGITHTLGKMYGVDDVYQLSRADAIAIYRKHFWDGELRGHLTSVRDQEIATAVFSMAVNTGTVPAVRVLQDALVEVGARVAVDGRIGPATVTAMNGVSAAILLRVFKKRWALYYCELVQSSVRAGRDYFKSRLAMDPQTEHMRRAFLNVNQVENLIGWVTRALR